MSNTGEEFTIPKCPLCGQEHTYILSENQTTTVLYKKRDPNKPHFITRIFTCPVKQENFQTTYE